MSGREHSRKELSRISRVADMMVTMHSSLRDKYAFRSAVLDCLLFASSIVLAALVFVDPVVLKSLGLSADNSRVLIGVFSLVIFFLSFVSMRIDWKGKSEIHKQAAQLYWQTKFRCAQLIGMFESLTEQEISDFLNRYEELGRSCAPIPDHQFLSLKQKHKMKVLLSKYLDENPGACMWLVRIRLLVKHTFRPDQGEPDASKECRVAG